MSDKHAKLMLPHLLRFFRSLTDDQKLLDLVKDIQTQLEQGHSATNNEEMIDNALISTDGSSGYIVQVDGKAGFRRFYKQEMFIKQEFKNSQYYQVDSHALNESIKRIDISDQSQKPETIDLQWQASLTFLSHSRFILSGGPGTGKTTTVIRMILLYLSVHQHNKVALAAPTGKAANRMMQSIRNMSQAMELPTDLLEKLTIKSQTLHRLLGYNPQNNKLKYQQSNPLPYDLVIIDEASMLDISLSHGLLKALKPNAQLVLMGDKNQLPAVEAGSVFADLCQLLAHKKPQINLLTSALNNVPVKEKDSVNIVELSKNYRFSAGSVVAALTQALIDQNFEQFKSHTNNPDFTWSNPHNPQDKSINLRNWFDSFSAEDSSILLSPTNYGSNSVDELNQLAMKILHGNHKKYENMPIIVNTNDYTLGVFNGDIGHLKFIDNKWYAHFLVEGDANCIQLEAIKSWQVAHAISIHKSQGSEYDHVLIAIPNDNELEILNNSLLYTAISRAKKTITLWSSETIIKKIIATNEKRVTFLN
jgi:exodeoxyribonuclease V alpha subunit